MQGPSQVSTPFTPNSFFASMLPQKGWVGASKLTLSPSAENPRYATDLDRPVWQSTHLWCVPQFASGPLEMLG